MFKLFFMSTKNNFYFKVFTQEEEQEPQDEDHLSDIKGDLVDEGDNTRPSSNGEVKIKSFYILWSILKNA